NPGLKLSLIDLTVARNDLRLAQLLKLFPYGRIRSLLLSRILFGLPERILEVGDFIRCVPCSSCFRSVSSVESSELVNENAETGRVGAQSGQRDQKQPTVSTASHEPEV